MKKLATRLLTLCGLALFAMGGHAQSVEDQVYVFQKDSLVFMEPQSSIDSVAFEDSYAKVTFYDKAGAVLFTSATADVDSIKFQSSAPKADVLDVVFNEDGTAKDLTGTFDVYRGKGEDKVVYYNEVFKRYGIRLNNPWLANNANTTDYYRTSVYGDLVDAMLADGHSMETIVLAAGNDEGIITDGEAKWFSSHQAGGTGFLICKQANGNGKNAWTFLPNVSDADPIASNWIWATDTVNAEVNKYYHLVGIWNKEEGKAYLYVNGLLVSTVDANGAYKPANAACHWFGIGADPSKAAEVNPSWRGEVVTTRIFDKALTPGEVGKLWQEVEYLEKKAGIITEPEPKPETPEEKEARLRAASPVADLLDIEFNADGSATDYSDANLAVSRYGAAAGSEGNAYVSWNKEWSMLGGNFRNPNTGSTAANGYYAASYAADEDFQAKLAAGHTIECVVMKGKQTLTTTATYKFFASSQTGGTGLIVNKVAEEDGRPEQTLSFHVATKATPESSVTWSYAYSGVVPEDSVYYHVIGVYDADAQKTYIYVNGELKGEADAIGAYEPCVTNALWFAIGADPSSKLPGAKNAANTGWVGEVTMPRIYGKALTAEEVAARYEYITFLKEKYAGSEAPEITDPIAPKPVVPEPDPEVDKVAEQLKADCPKADMLDVVFNADGTAEDVSDMKMTVAIGKGSPATEYNETYKCYMAKFDNPWSASAGKSTGWYRVDYRDNADFQSKLADGHSMECIVLANGDNGVITESKEAKWFSTHQGGGTGFYINNINASDPYRDKKYWTFLVGIDTTDAETPAANTWIHTTSGIEPEVGKYYHLVGIWNKEEGKTYIYVNGQLACERTDATGEYFPATDGGEDPTKDCRYFAIGADPATWTTANTAWNGNVVTARIYDKPLTDAEAKNLWRYVNYMETGNVLDKFEDPKDPGTPETPEEKEARLKAASPVADMLDVEFKEDGSAVDNSPLAKTVEKWGGANTSLGAGTAVTYLNTDWNIYGSRYDNPPSGTATGYYAIKYMDDENFQNKLADGHTLECIVSRNFDWLDDTSKSYKYFSTTQGGGSALMVNAIAADRPEFTLTYQVYTDGNDVAEGENTQVWNYAYSGIVPEKGEYYHVMGVWNPEEKKVYIYVNGELKGEAPAGPTYIPAAVDGTKDSRWFAIGADPKAATPGVTKNAANTAWAGDVLMPRIYDKPLTAEEVKARWEYVSFLKEKNATTPTPEPEPAP